MEKYRVVIAGAGQAGVNCALALRQHGYDGDIVLLSDESDAPYDRPPLSKHLASAPTPITTHDVLAGQRIDLRLGASAVALNRDNKTIRLTDGGELDYGTLVLATGGSARVLPGLPVDRQRIFTLRDIADARALSATLPKARSVLVIGGGWLGLELAATARQSGCAVTVVEGASRLCQRSLPKDVSQYLHKLHIERGVEIVTGVMPSLAVGPNGVSAAWNGGEYTFDIAIVAIGLAANDGLARNAGIACDDGVLTDANGRTNDPSIFAAGDVARAQDDRFGERVRLESWKHAIAQGQRVAQVICGQTVAAFEAPWFWSEQYDRLIQIAGMPAADLTLVSFEDGLQPIWRYGRDGETLLAIGVNRARDIRQAHRAMSAPKTPMKVVA